jgi:DNA-binding MarR family transcriptional regulator
LQNKGRKAAALLTVCLMMGVLDAPAMGAPPADGTGGSRGFQPFAGDQGWTDSLDDLSHVYVNTTMPVGVEVNGGDAHLKAWWTDGWLASEVIRCPTGYRFDLAILEVDTPGNSTVRLTVLDATVASNTQDFANGTISGFKYLKATDVSLNPIDHVKHPEIRLQVDLHADGTDKPRLLSWSVLFIDEGEWRDDFIGTGKMEDLKYINLTDDKVEIDLTPNMGSPLSDYKEYPTIAHGKHSGGWRLTYANADRTGYDPIEDLAGPLAYATGFGDFDNDGNLDLFGGVYSGTSRILWGDDEAKYRNNNGFDINTDRAEGFAAGDFNGDGWEDFAVSRYNHGGATSTHVYLNQGNGSFNSDPDIEFPNYGFWFVHAGDINNDGYDDIMTSGIVSLRVFYGGPFGPDTTADISIGKTRAIGAYLEDLDVDGYLDIVFFGSNGENTTIYLGGPTGPDTTADYSLIPPPNMVMGHHGVAGDLNNDGLIEIMQPFRKQNNDGLLVIYKGSASGWSSSDVHNVDVAWNPYMAIGDLDRDGYDDFLIHQAINAPNPFVMDIFMGGPTWPSVHDVRLQDVFGPGPAPTIAIPRGGSGERAYIGTFTTEGIDLPAGMKWDIINIEADVPANTTLRYSVLNGTGSPILADITDMDLDLSMVNPQVHRTIKIEVTITTDFNNTTPRMDHLLVKWYDEMSWRDQFYGPAKVDRLYGLDVAGGTIGLGSLGGTGPQIIVPSLRDDMTHASMSYAHMDAGGLDYVSRSPMAFQTSGVMATAVADVNNDGFMDVAFATYADGAFDFETVSTVYLGTPVGWRDIPHWTHNTTGARDVLLEDLDDDGYVDIVLCQEQDGITYSVDSLLFWGSVWGWDEEPDVRFKTKGASGVVAEDLNGDGHLDLAFACYADGTSTDTDSMVFLHDEGSFDGSKPDLRLATKGARAVAAGDLNGDDRPDLVFANSRAGGGLGGKGSVYMAKDGGGFTASGIDLRTHDAQDVKVVDLDGDGHLDIVFANLQDASGDHSVGSPVFINDGTGGFPDSPTVTLATTGAMAVEVADMDGIGWKDLLFACHYDGSSYEQTSVGYLGDSSGYPSTPNIQITTPGASDVEVAYLFDPGDCGYMSQTIAPHDLEGTGGYHTFSYTALLGGDVTGTFHVYDAISWERLADTSIVDGNHEWDLRGQVYYKNHNHIRIVAEVEGMDPTDTFELDDLSLNWTRRVMAPPRVVDISLDKDSEYRTNTVTMWLNASDEYDPPEDLDISVEYRLEGDAYWQDDMLGAFECVDGTWTVEFQLPPQLPLGIYQFRASAIDKDDMESLQFISPVTLEVLNNIPTTPEIVLTPETPVAGDTLTVSITRSAQDAEDTGLVYRFKWFRSGVWVPAFSSDRVPGDQLVGGQNWSVEVRAFDGDDEGPAAAAWVIIGNTPPSARGELLDLEFDEDGEAQTFELSPVFHDPDADVLTYGVETASDNLTIDVDDATGRVSIAPAADWHGSEELTFWASDGDGTARQVVTVIVNPVNDPPRFVEVNGKPVATGVMVLTVLSGNTLVITYSYNDVEGDLVMLSVDSDEVTLDDFLREIRFTPTDDMVGTLTFTLTLWDLASPDEKQILEFQIIVENVNNPPGLPRITAPPDGSRFDVNESFDLVGTCDDPDIRFGQVLTFTWSSNIIGVLGTGTTHNLSLADPGTHLITLTVSDGEYESSATVTIVIVPPVSIAPPPPEPPTPEEDVEGIGWALPIIVILALLGVILAAAVSTEPGKYRWGLMFAPMLIKKDDVLDNKTRYALHGIIVERPGIHYSAIKEEFGLSNGVAAYHLDVLEREEFIRSVRDGRLKRFYSHDTKVPKNPEMTPEQTREAIIQLVREQPGISQQRIINELGIERPSAGYFLRELVKEGQLKAEKQGLYTMYRVK